MNPFSQVLASLLSSSTLSVRLTRAFAAAGMVIQMTPPEGKVAWSAVGLAALVGLLGAGEPNATK